MGLKSKSLDKVRDDVPVGAVTREESTRININVPLSMRKRWKMAAAQANRPLTDMMIEAMDKYLSTQKH
uniref:Putative partitioning protein ParB n=1 Tax=Polaromonas sp. H8N TaxID=1840297 RepID=A0A2S1FJD5_9BURK|nr:hypothetical protein [Polaromonas sp. H8N]AWD72307.1 putative partitioning protein ParB [Polaromonas sp. H8N]